MKIPSKPLQLRWFKSHNMKSEAGQIQILSAVLFMIAIPVAIIVAQNTTNTTDNITKIIEGYVTLTNETLDLVFNETFSNSTGDNLSITNETYFLNETNHTSSHQESNETEQPKINTTEPNITEPKVSEKPELSVEVISPDKFVRGYVSVVKAKITNLGTIEAKNVHIKWNLPKGFEILSENDNCKSIKPGSFCVAEVNVSVSQETDLGLGRITVLVSCNG